MDESAESSFESNVARGSASPIAMGGGSARLSFLAIDFDWRSVGLGHGLQLHNLGSYGFT
jgi:hypothetical protein